MQQLQTKTNKQTNKIVQKLGQSMLQKENKTWDPSANLNLGLLNALNT